MNKIGAWILVLAVCLVCTAGAFLGLGIYLNTPPESPEEGVFKISAGSSVNSIAARLEREGFIRSRYIFRILTLILNTDTDIQAGNYYIDPGLSALEIHDLFLTGREILEQVTIAEGLPLSRIAEILHDSGITDRDEFIEAAHDEKLLRELGIPGDTAEGYIYPDTYKFAKEFPAENTLRFMVQSFWNTLADIYPEYKAMTSSQIYRNVIIASIVEREYRVADEAPYIASVFLNRMEIGMPLQSCATVVYALTQEYGKPHPRYLTYSDLEVESMYNTYRIQGLPPAPISNPGKTALESVFFPAETDYLYFVLQNPDDGRHYFSKTLSEHNQAKQFYIKER